MKSESMQGPRRPRVVHSWRCTRKGPFTETTIQRPTGQAQVITRCEECNATDELAKEAS